MLGCWVKLTVDSAFLYDILKRTHIWPPLGQNRKPTIGAGFFFHRESVGKLLPCPSHHTLTAEESFHPPLDPQQRLRLGWGGRMAEGQNRGGLWQILSSKAEQIVYVCVLSELWINTVTGINIFDEKMNKNKKTSQQPCHGRIRSSVAKWFHWIRDNKKRKRRKMTEDSFLVVPEF